MALVDIITKLFSFLFSIIGSLVSLLEFISSYILDLPIILMDIFTGLPTFAQTGISVILCCLIVVFVLRLIKLIGDVKNLV